MSSMRNAVQRRNHKERAQPKEREKWGILEKHKDYSLRAKDYNEKKKRLKILKQKASARNPDEFHFAMMSHETHKRGPNDSDRGNKGLSHDTVKLLKTQDAGYLRTMSQQTRRIRERLEQAIVFKAPNASDVDSGFILHSDSHHRQHVAFLDPEEDHWPHSANKPGTTNRTSDAPVNEPLEPDLDAVGDDTVQKSQPSRQNTSLSTTMNSEVIQKQARALRKRRKRELVVRQARLDALKNREASLLAAEKELGLQRANMHSTSGGVTKAGVKFKVRGRKK